MSEVRGVLEAVCDAVWSVVQERPRYQVTGDPVVPRFVFTATAMVRLEQTVPRGRAVGSAKLASAQIVREQWQRARDAHPHLWSYQAWRAERVRELGTRALDNSQFAEHMRAKRGTPSDPQFFTQEMLERMRNDPALFAANVLPEPPSFSAVKVVESCISAVPLGFDPGFVPSRAVVLLKPEPE